MIKTEWITDWQSQPLKNVICTAPAYWPSELWILVMLVAQAEPDAAWSAQVLMIWDCNGVEIQWKGRITAYYRGTFCSQWEFLNVADNVNCMSLWAAMSSWDYSALAYLTFITPRNSMVHHVVITGLCAEHLFLISQIIFASLH